MVLCGDIKRDDESHSRERRARFKVMRATRMPKYEERDSPLTAAAQENNEVYIRMSVTFTGEGRGGGRMSTAAHKPAKYTPTPSARYKILHGGLNGPDVL